AITALFKLDDRAGRHYVLPLTHEETFAFHAREIQSYKELPQSWYHFQTKDRDEPRPRGGLIRVREFIMKDSYSFDRDEAGLDESFRKHGEAYWRIFERCGLEVHEVAAESGIMGGSRSRLDRSDRLRGRGRGRRDPARGSIRRRRKPDRLSPSRRRSRPRLPAALRRSARREGGRHMSCLRRPASVPDRDRGRPYLQAREQIHTAARSDVPRRGRDREAPDHGQLRDRPRARARHDRRAEPRRARNRLA